MFIKIIYDVDVLFNGFGLNEEMGNLLMRLLREINKVYNLSVILFTAALFISGCGNAVFNADIPDTWNAGRHYPLEIDNYDGYSGGGRLVHQIFTKPPERIVAASESTIDNLIFLGLEDKIVGIGDVAEDNHGEYEEIYKRIPRMGEKSYPPKESIIAARPDIIIGWGSLFGDKELGSVKNWHERGIHTYVMKNTVPVVLMERRKVEYFIEDLHNLAKIFNIESSVKDRIEVLEKRMKMIKDRGDAVRREGGMRILTIQYVYDNQYFGRSRTDMTSDIIELLGGISLDGETGGKQGMEFLIKLNPDVLLVINHTKAPAKDKIKVLMENPAVQSVNAVKYKRFLILDYNAFYGGSERTIQEVERLQDEIGNFEK